MAESKRVVDHLLTRRIESCNKLCVSADRIKNTFKICLQIFQTDKQTSFNLYNNHKHTHSLHLTEPWTTDVKRVYLYAYRVCLGNDSCVSAHGCPQWEDRKKKLYSSVKNVIHLWTETWISTQPGNRILGKPYFTKQTVDWTSTNHTRESVRARSITSSILTHSSKTTSPSAMRPQTPVTDANDGWERERRELFDMTLPRSLISLLFPCFHNRCWVEHPVLFDISWTKPGF